MRDINRFIVYLKPYKFTLIVLFIGFVFQQICSLFLPMLMADIVDIGIRQSGIENASPEVISVKSYYAMAYFMHENEKDDLTDNYIFVNPNNFKENKNIINSNKTALKLDQVYGLSSDNFKEGLYVLKDISDIEREEIDKCFLNSTSRLIKYINSNPNKNEIIVSNDQKYSFSINLSKLYDLVPAITSITEDELLDIDGTSLGDFDPYQAASSLNCQFYNELGVDTLGIQRRYILKIGLLMLLATFISLIFVVVENYYSAKMSSGISLRLRDNIFKKVESFSEKEFDKISVSSLITRTTNDVSQVKDTILMGVNFLVPPIMFTGGIIMAIRKSVSMSWTIMLGAIISSAIIITVFFIIFPKVKVMQELLDKFNLIVRERLSGLMVINSLGNIDIEEKRFDKENKKLSNISTFVNRTVMITAPFLTVSMNLISILIIWLGAKQISASMMQVGDLMAFTQYSTMVIGAFLMLVMMFSSLPHALISMDRVLEILETESSIKDPEIPMDFKESLKGQIYFKDVCFSYGDNENYVLKNINFTVNPGQITGIIGPTGSGKSTLVKLIPRFYDATLGEILIDNINIKDVKQYDLREKVSYVPQKSVLFTGSILYNLKYGNQNADENKIKECAEISEISELLEENNNISKKESDKLISQGGGNLSGGQRQRVCIARSLARNSYIYIFDDSFSSLDFNTESIIREKIFKKLNNTTVIVVSQRVGAIMGADKIIVLDKGEIVGEGTHKSLVKECKSYREIVESQMPEEVLI